VLHLTLIMHVLLSVIICELLAILDSWFKLPW